MSSFLRKIGKTITRHQLLKGGERILLGVSGGPDSMALLHALWELRREWRFALIVAYLDHGLRAEAAAEQSFVHQTAADLGLPFVTERAEVRALRQEKRLPLQEAAREARYNFFLRAASDFAADKIALGHTADDQAETVLMHWLRGSGTRGLAGIPPKRDDRIIRPLIEVSRQEVESFLQERKIPYREDASNRSFQFLRNRVRHELLPTLEDYNPRIRQVLCQMAERFRLEEEYWQTLVGQKIPLLVRKHRSDGVTLNIPLLAELPVSLRLRIFRQATEAVLGHLRGFGFLHFQAVENLWQNPAPHKKIHLPCRICVFKSYGDLNFSFESEETAGFEYLVPGPGILKIPQIRREMRFSIRDKNADEVFGGPPDLALLEADHLHFPLIVRSFRPGDRFRPFGMAGEKKIKDFFIDRKIPLTRRREIPLLFFQGQLLWIAGLRLDDRYRLKPESRQVLQVEIQQIPR